jgi:hypothetical protein
MSQPTTDLNEHSHLPPNVRSDGVSLAHADRLAERNEQREPGVHIRSVRLRYSAEHDRRSALRVMGRAICPGARSYSRCYWEQDKSQH